MGALFKIVSTEAKQSTKALRLGEIAKEGLPDHVKVKGVIPCNFNKPAKQSYKGYRVQLRLAPYRTTLQKPEFVSFKEPPQWRTTTCECLGEGPSASCFEFEVRCCTYSLELNMGLLASFPALAR